MTQQETAMDGTVAAEIVKCRYRLVTGCTAEYEVPVSLASHEKTAHADIHVALRECPVCGNRFDSDAGRARHLSVDHGIVARSLRRQELDALQVKAAVEARDDAPPPGPDPVPVPAAVPPSPNGHHPAPVDIAAAEGTFTALAAELYALREENAALRADAEKVTQIRSMLAGQD